MRVINNIRNNVNARASIKQGVVEHFSIYGDDEYAARPGQTPPDLPSPETITS